MQTLPLIGMSCNSCVEKIQKRLEEHPEVSRAEVTLDPPKAMIDSTRDLDRETLNDWLQSVGDYQIPEITPPVSSTPLPAKDATTYRPLLILLGYLLLVIGAANLTRGGFDAVFSMRLFMGGFFIAFSFFKMLDLRGFADAYRSYDLVTKAIPAYGWIYPFIELVLGLAYLADYQPFLTNAITAFVMTVSLVGVLRAVLSKKAIRCACLGTVFNLPMSTVTIIENGLMLAMALIALLA